MIRLFAALILVVTFLGVVQTEAVGGTAIVLTDEVQLKLGDAFTAEGEYYRAITEYKKLLILFPDSPHAGTALFNVGTAYYRGEEYESAEKAFASYRKQFPAGSQIADAAYQQGLALVRLKQPDLAAEAFAAAASAPASADQRKAKFGKVIAEYDQGGTAAGRRELEWFVAEHPADPGAQQASAALSTLEQHQDLPTRSPLVAGILSAIVPGSGHIYAGHYGDGITAMLLNGLFIAGTVLAVQQENYAIAGAAGLIGLPFYIGNIYGAANAATKWNLALKKDLRGKLAVTLEYPFW